MGNLCTHPVFEPICLRSGLCKRVERGGGLYCPSKLPLKVESVNKSERPKHSDQHSHIDGKVNSVRVGEGILLHHLSVPTYEG